MKGDQSSLTVAINRLQTEKIESSGSDSGKNNEKIGADPPPPPSQPTHKPCFPCYIGATDLMVWLYEADQFLPAQRTPEEKVWFISDGPIRCCVLDGTG